MLAIIALALIHAAVADAAAGLSQRGRTPTADAIERGRALAAAQQIGLELGEPRERPRNPVEGPEQPRTKLDDEGVTDRRN